MNWTHEELKSFSTVSKYGRVIQKETWFKIKSGTIFIKVETDLESQQVHILEGYFITGNRISPERNWMSLEAFSEDTLWVEVLTPKHSEYDPKQQPYEDSDI